MCGGVYKYRTYLNNFIMNDSESLKMQCVDYATRIVGKPAYITDKDGDVEKHQDDVIQVAKRIYEFVTRSGD